MKQSRLYLSYLYIKPQTYLPISSLGHNDKNLRHAERFRSEGAQEVSLEQQIVLCWICLADC